MATYDPTTHKDLVAAGGNLKDALPVDARIKLMRLMSTLGLIQILAQNTAPSDKDVIWFHIDIKTPKRFDAVAGNWFPITGNQLAMHFFRRAILGSGSEVALENGDLFLFWDESLGEVKKINRQNLMNALGALRTVATTGGIKGGGTLDANRTLSLDIPGLTEKTEANLDDMVVVWDEVAQAHRKIPARKLLQSNAGMNFFYSGQ